MMKKTALLVLMSTISLSALILPSQSSDGYSRDGRASFTDNTIYNAADHDGNPLGWLERDTSIVSLTFAFSHLELAASNTAFFDKVNDFALPVLRVGQPHVGYFQVFYTPAFISSSARNYNSSSLLISPPDTDNLPLHRFGFTLVGGVPSGYLQAGLSAEGYYGKEDRGDVSTASRVILGVGGLKLFLGSQMHPLVRVGFMVAADGYYDTLFVNGQNNVFQDRFGSCRLPIVGGFIGFGKKDFPVLSNFSLYYAIPRFLYTTKPNTNPGGNENVIRGDSIGWDWQTIGTVTSIGPVDIHPAFTIGSWSNNNQVYLPTQGNDNLVKFGPALIDSTWEFSSFNFGLGVSADLWKNHTLWIEYSHSTFSLTYGDAYRLLWKDKEQIFDNFRMGITSSINAIKALSFPEHLCVRLRAGFSNYGQNSAFPRGPLSLVALMDTVGPGSNLYRYEPGVGAVSSERITGVSLGAEGGYLPFVNCAFDITFLSNSRGMTGTRLDLFATFMLPQKQ
jgi:hypothetical protein